MNALITVTHLWLARRIGTEPLNASLAYGGPRASRTNLSRATWSLQRLFISANIVSHQGSVLILER